MFSGLILVTRPASAPVTLADVKAHARLDSQFTTDDAVLSGYITSATRVCEERAKWAFMPQTWRLTLEHFPGRNPRTGYQIAGPEAYAKWNHIEIPKPPLIAITAFTYTDTAGNVFNMSQGYGNAMGNYLLDLDCEPNRIVLPFSGIWPTTILLPASPIALTYQCGFSAFAGTVTVDSEGVCTWATGNQFDPGLAGTWVTLGNEWSCNVLAVTDDTHMQLVLPDGFEAGPMAWTGNLVPMHYRHAILFLVSHFYETGEPIMVGRGLVALEVSLTLDELLAIDRIYRT